MNNEDNVIKVCPVCDDADISVRTRLSHKWRCEICGATFDEAKERKRKTAGLSAEAVLKNAFGADDDTEDP